MIFKIKIKLCVKPRDVTIFVTRDRENIVFSRTSQLVTLDLRVSEHLQACRQATSQRITLIRICHQNSLFLLT